MFARNKRCQTASWMLCLSLGLGSTPAWADDDGDNDQGNGTTRPLSDFLERQGAFCIRDDFGAFAYTDTGTRDGVCPFPELLFIPPVKNFVGQSDPARELAASIDYAGLSEQNLGPLGTEFDGYVREWELEDGRALVAVWLETENALTYVLGEFVDPNNFDFSTAPVLLGNRVDDIQAGAEAALGESTFSIVFKHTGPREPLPDLVQLLFLPNPGQEVLSIAFDAEAEGPTPEGGEGEVEVIQRCPKPCSPDFFFPVEDILLELDDDDSDSD